MRRIVALSFLLFASCSPSSLADLKVEAESEMRQLAQLLREVDTKEQLIAELPKIKKSYLKIADLVVQVRGLGTLDEPTEPGLQSEALFSELARLYEMPGCRALIESAQQEAILRLSN